MNEMRTQKQRLRARLLEARRALTPDERRAAGEALVPRVREWPPATSARTVAAYASMGTEPGTRELVEALHAGGTRVILPVLQPDNDLDWARYDGPGSLEGAARGLMEPRGERLGLRAVIQADVVLLPGLAVDVHGVRLGRGGGSYDRVLERLAAAGTRPGLAVLLYAHEVVGAVPREPHDHLVDAAITPEGVTCFRHPGGTATG